jgi:hypothetical protein
MPFDGMPYSDKAKEFGFVPMNHAEPNYFDVGKVDVFDDKQNRIEGYAAIKRLDTYDTLAIHSDRYTPILDRDVFSAFENGLDRAGFNLKNMGVSYDRSHNGARMFVQYVLPEHSREVNGAPVSLRFLMWNSHDGSRAASGRCGFYSWVCANQSVRGKDLGAFDVRHAGDAAIVTARIDRLIDGAKEAETELALMQAWAKREILDATALNIFGLIPAASDQLIGQLMVDWTRAKDGKSADKGPTLYGLYNVLTAWATHTKGKTKNEANACVERQERIGKVFQMKEWKELAAA